MSTLIQDLRFALRSLRRAPAFPLAAIATLALGIAATTAIFSTLNAVLLKPLPYPQADALYNIRTTLIDGRVTTGMLSNGEVSRVNVPGGSIAHAAGLQTQDLTLLHDDGTPEHVQVSAVTENFFDVFGLPMTLGGFKHDDFVPPAPPAPNTPPAPGPLPAVVISTRAWRDLYHSNPAVVGTPIHFAEANAVIAGVAPDAFDTPHRGDFWFAQRLGVNDINHFFDGYLRLAPGATIERANAEMGAAMAGLGKEFPASDFNRAYLTKPLVTAVVGDLGPILIIVMSATGLLLLLACVNVTNLLLARSAARAREMAVRVSLGAGRGRIVRQLITESALLASAGAILGVGLAYAGVRMLMTLGARNLPRLDAVAFDGRVLLFALAALVASALLVGFAPALRLAGTDVRSLINESTRSTTGGRGTARWLSAMTIAEIALAIVLVTGAGWLVRGFAQLKNTNLGFAAANHTIFDVTLLGAKDNSADAVAAGTQELSRRLLSLPGVVSVGATSNFPLKGTAENSLIAAFHGEGVDPANPMGTRQRFVTAGYFAATGTPLVTGRDFGPDDRQNTTPVALVNRTFQQRYLRGRDPIGVRFAAGYPAPNPQNEVTVIGVVDDIRQKSVTDDPEPAFYSPLSQVPVRRLTMVVQTAPGRDRDVRAALAGEVHRFDPQIAVAPIAVADLVSSTTKRQELGMTLMLIFGGAAILLAAVGIYGVVAYAVSERRAEMATRLALGASPASVFALVVKQGAVLAGAGIAIGAIAAYLSGRVVTSWLTAVRASDASTFVVAALIVAAISAMATMVPAWRASRLKPSSVLHAG